MRPAVYLRVSSRDQSVESQRAEVIEWLKTRGLSEDAVVWYVDKESGTTLKRPAFTQLREAVALGQVQEVIVIRLDRLSRTLLDGLSVLSEWLERGVRVVATTQQFDLHGATGRLVAAILLAVAEMEMSLRRERQAAGIKLAKRRGAYKGSKPGRRKVSPARVVELRAKGFTAREIGKALGVHYNTVYGYLKEQEKRDGATVGTATRSSGSDDRPVDFRPDVRDLGGPLVGHE